ncbi:hypothetical protein BLA29_005162 [Euroglyphus maynei]|uniref:Uncharacterized protein n=1 Tax=Euroglyphus maynei TaxID=6958 RepID=A0A1Y3APQ5_EURMA|nr:hypothetical protein BLA29_005162 [Euroglyphus maynei]
MVHMSMPLMHGDHFDGALGHGLVHGNEEPQPEPSTLIEPYSHLPSYLHDHGHPPVHLPPELDHHRVGHPDPYHLNGVELRFHPEDLAVHGYQQLSREPHHQHGYPPHQPMYSSHPIPLAEHYDPFYGHRKPGDGFGPGGHFSVMPHQEIKYFPVPEPVPVYKPVPVEKPYPVPVDKPYPVKIDRPVPEPYVAKVVQPIIHKQAIIKSHVTHQTYEMPYPHHHYHHSSYNNKKA